MTNGMQVISVAAGVTGAIIVGTTGLLWPIVPIALAVAVGKAIADYADKPKEPKK